MKGVFKVLVLLSFLGLVSWNGTAEVPFNGSDSFGSRPALSPGNLFQLDFTDATLEPGETLLSPFEGGYTRWWKIQAPKRGVLVVRGPIGNTPTLALMRGDGLSALSMVGSNVTECVTFRFGILAAEVEANEILSLVADAPGELIRYVVDGNAQATLSVDLIPQPSNDDFDNALPLPAEPQTIEADLFAASSQPGEPAVMETGSGGSVWFTWTAPAYGNLVISPVQPALYPGPQAAKGPLPWEDAATFIETWPLLAGPYYLPVGYTNLGKFEGAMDGLYRQWGGGGGGGVVIRIPGPCGSDLHSPLLEPAVPEIAVFTGESVTSLTRVASGSSVEFAAQPGKTYRIAIAAARGSPQITRLHALFRHVPVNDDRLNAIALTGPSTDASGYTGASTREGFEGSEGPGTVWWSWTAESEGPVLVSAAGDRINLQLVVWREFGPDAPQAVLTRTNSLSFYAERGQKFSVSLAALGDATQYALSLRQLPSRLRPIGVRLSSGRSDLLIPEAVWRRGLLQTAVNGRWVDAGTLEALPVPSGRSALGYSLSLNLTNASSLLPGQFRAWILDFEPTSPTLKFNGLATFGHPGVPSLTIGGPPGGRFRIQSTEDLVDWYDVATVQTDGRERLFLDKDYYESRQMFYRLVESVLVAQPVLSDP